MSRRSLAPLALAALAVCALAWFTLNVEPNAAVDAAPGSNAHAETKTSDVPELGRIEPERGTEIRVPAVNTNTEPTSKRLLTRFDSGAVPNSASASFKFDSMPELELESIVVTGTVRGAVPLEGLRVTFTGGRPMGYHYPTPEMVETDSLGRYEITLTSRSSYSVRLDGPGIATQVRTVRIPEEGTVVDFDLPSSRIAGWVLGPDGRPVKYVRVQLSADDTANGSILEHPQSAWTDEAGRFVFGCVEAGTYRLATDVMSMAGERYVRNGVPVVALRGIEVGSQSSVEGLEIRLTAGATVLVQVLSPDGSPASGATVEWLQGFGVVGQATADSVGVARLVGLAPGETRLFARASSGAVKTGQTFELHARAVVETTIRLQPGTVLNVRLEDLKGKLVTNWSGKTVIVRDATNRSRPAHQSPYGRAEGGRFGPLPEGDYDVHVEFGSGKEVRQTVYVSGGTEQQLVVREPD